MNDRLIRLLFGMLVALCCATATAAPANSEAPHLHQLRLALQGTLGDFYLLYGVDADPQHIASIEQRLRSARADLQALPANPASTLPSEWASYDEQLRRMVGDLQQHKELDGNAIAELVARHTRLLKLVAQAQAQSASGAALNPAERTRQLQWLLQSIATSYIAYSVGANTLGGDGQDIGELVRQFDSGLNGLQPHPNQQRLLGDIQHKWRYIEPSLRNYQTSAISSLVNRYATQIITEIDQLPSDVAEVERAAN